MHRLDEALTRPLTSITGPVGMGKSVLVAQWCRERPTSLPVAWIGLERIAPEDVIATVLAALHDLTGITHPIEASHDGSPDPATIAPATLAAMADLAANAPESVLVLDGVGFHEPLGIAAELASVLERARNCGVHLIAIGRRAPVPAVLPLRLRGSAAHIDAAHLELRAPELAGVVWARSGHKLSAGTSDELTEALEGWLAGAVIVGLTHPGSPNGTAGDLLDAAADDIDALVTAEILSDLPEDIRRFVQLTACVDEVSPALCDAMTGRTDSERLLNDLRMAGFPVRRAGHDGGLRYLRPVRQVLDVHAAREDPAERAAALRRAAAFYSEHKRPFEAADCWRRLGDWDQVIGVIMLHLQQILEMDEFGRLSELVAKAPPAVMREHAALALAGGWVLRMDGRISAAYELVAIYEPFMTEVGKLVANVVRCGVASWVEDVEGLLDFARAALAACDELGDEGVADRPRTLPAYTPDSADTYRMLANGAAVLACCYAGRWDDGEAHLVEPSATTIANMPQLQTVQVRGNRATFFALSGRIAEAEAEARAAVAMAADAQLLEHRSTADAFCALGEARRLALDHDDARQWFAKSLPLAQLNGRRNLVSTIVSSQAQLLIDAGAPGEALEILERHRATGRHRSPKVLAGLLAAAEARALASDGSHRRALRRLDLAPITPATATARVAISLFVGDLARARDCALRWPTEHTVDSVVRRQLAIAVLSDTAGARAAADAALRAALVAGADHRLSQPFIEYGPLIARLLRRIDSDSTEPTARDLARHVHALVTGGSVAAMAPRFTTREAVVLSHLAEGMSLAEVASAIHLSVNTVKTHVKGIYRKLGVNTRAGAISAWQSSARRTVGG